MEAITGCDILVMETPECKSWSDITNGKYWCKKKGCGTTGMGIPRYTVGNYVMLLENTWNQIGQDVRDRKT